jgi:hypothetical protein
LVGTVPSITAAASLIMPSLRMISTGSPAASASSKSMPRCSIIGVVAHYSYCAGLSLVAVAGVGQRQLVVVQMHHEHVVMRKGVRHIRRGPTSVLVMMGIWL